MKLPHIVSNINGMKIPLLSGQAGIMHRYETPENRLYIKSVHNNGADQPEPERMQIAEPAEPTSPRNKPKAAAQDKAAVTL